MCCGGIVAYYVECTNVVKKWYGSDCNNRACQGRRGWFFKPLGKNNISVMFCGMTSVVLTEHESEREEESAEFKNIYSLKSPPSLNDTDKCCLLPPPVSPERVWSV